MPNRTHRARSLRIAGRLAPAPLLGAVFLATGTMVPTVSRAQSDASFTGNWPVSIQIQGVERCGGGCPFDDGDVYMRVYIEGQGGGKRDIDYDREGEAGCIMACGVWQGNICVALNDQIETQNVGLACNRPIEVVIEQWEEDGSIFDPDDDLCMRRTIQIDPESPPSLVQCEDDGGGGFCYTVTLGTPTPLDDSDGDGLFDTWEMDGYDGDCDGEMDWGPDVLLPQLGVNPVQKDVLVELDWYDGYAPTAAEVDAVRQMFARAPDDAGGIVAPGLGGIRMVFDAGQQVDTAGARIGDELEHYSGGVNLGNPNQGPSSDDDIRQLAAQVVDAPQIGIFRTIVFGPEYVVAGGHTMGDFIYLDRTDSLAIAHELGHSMGLGHGGDEAWNCKPNHYSIMNYTYAGLGLPYVDAFGVQQRFLDFAPAQIDDPSLPQNVRMPLLQELIETNTDEDEWEAQTLPNFLPRQEIIYTNGNGQPTTVLVGGPAFTFIDWNDNTLQDSDNTPGANVDQGVVDDVNLDSFAPNPAIGYLGIDACAQDPQNQAVTGASLRHVDEWSMITMKPTNGVGDPLYVDVIVPDPMPSPEEAASHVAASALADLYVTGSVVTEPIHVDAPFLVSIAAGNNGPSVAHEVQVRLTFPEGVDYLSSSHDCEEGAPGVLDCALVLMPAGSEQTISLEIVAAANATLGSRELSVQVLHAGGELAPTDNAVDIPIELIPAFASFEDAEAPWIRSWTTPPQPATLADDASDGEHSMALACGYSSFDSPTFDTVEWEVIGSELWVDVFVPVAQSNPNGVGELQLYFDLPSGGLYNLFAGQVDLTGLERGSWVTVSFAVSEQVREKMLGDFPDGRLRLAGQIGSCLAPVLVDNLRFAGDLVSRTQYHGQSIEVDVVGPLSFDDPSAWSSAQVMLYADTAQRIEGLASLAFAPAAWTEITSRPLTPAEAAHATILLHLGVYVPELPPDPYWVGAVQAYLECPSAAVYNQYIGQESLYPSFDEEFNSLLFSVPAGLVAVLQGGAADCKVKFAVSMNPAWGELRFDRGGFVEP